MLREIPAALIRELRSFEAGGPRGTEALGAAISVALATFVALFLHSDEPWWAATSAWMVTRSSLRVALSSAVTRIIGSVAGAAIAVIVTGRAPTAPKTVPIAAPAMICQPMCTRDWASVTPIAIAIPAAPTQFPRRAVVGGQPARRQSRCGTDHPHQRQE